MEINPNDNQLQYGYALWYSRRSVGKQTDRRYAENLKFIGRFGSVEQFWSLYSHLVRPSELTAYSDFHLFKHGIKPMWEVSLPSITIFKLNKTEKKPSFTIFKLKKKHSFLR